MKKLIVSLLLAYFTAQADTSITVNTTQDVNILLQPNGSLSGTPTWSFTGTGSLVPAPDARSARLVTSGTGTNVVTVVAPSGTNTLTVRITVTVIAMPATALDATATAVAK